MHNEQHNPYLSFRRGSSHEGSAFRGREDEAAHGTQRSSLTCADA